MGSNDGMLSQEEIDALLGNANSADTEPTNMENDPLLDEVLSPMEMDALGEIGNISFGSAATALSTLLNQKVDITTPTVTVMKKEKFQDEFPLPYVSVRVEYTDGFEGSNVLLIRQEDASIIADLMLGGSGTPSDEINEIHLSAVQEAMNQMMGSSATSMSMLFDKRIDISPPKTVLLSIIEEKGMDNIPPEDIFIKVSFRLRVGELIDSNIMQLMPIGFSKELVTSLLNSGDLADENESNKNPLSIENHVQSSDDHLKQVNGADLEMKNHMSQYPEDNYYKNEAKDMGRGNNRLNQQPIDVHPAAFAEFNTFNSNSINTSNIDLLLDIPLNVTVELGQTQKKIKEILDLSPGSVIELDKLAGEPVDVLINHKPIAKGEVVVIDENFGVRITEIINRRDRLENLN